MSSTDTPTTDLVGIDRIEVNASRQRALNDRDVALECLRVTVDQLWERVTTLEAENERLREGDR